MKTYLASVIFALALAASASAQTKTFTADQIIVDVSAHEAERGFHVANIHFVRNYKNGKTVRLTVLCLDMRRDCTGLKKGDVYSARNLIDDPASYPVGDGVLGTIRISGLQGVTVYAVTKASTE